MPTEQDRIRELNRYPHTEAGFCTRCGEWYSLTQLRIPVAIPLAMQQPLPPQQPGTPPSANIAYGIAGLPV